MNNTLRLAIINWRTTLPGAIFVLALFLRQNPDALSGLVSAEVAKQIFGWASLLSGLATFATSKASNISGNGTPQNPARDAAAAPSAPSTIHDPLRQAQGLEPVETAPSTPLAGFIRPATLISLFGISALVLLFVMLLIPGCATNTGNAKRDRAGRVTNAVLADVGDAVVSYATATLVQMVEQSADGKSIDMASAASQGLYTSAPGINVADDVSRVIDAWSGHTLPGVSAQAAQSFALADPQTPSDKAAIVNTIAASLSQAAKAASKQASDAMP